MMPVAGAAAPKYDASRICPTSTAFWMALRIRMSASAGFSTFMPSHV